MFRHIGETRTLNHNLKIASLLSFVAGLVNVAGFLSIQRLTTNVTGHFALMADEIYRLNFLQGIIFFCYILFFFLGSFVSNFLIEIISRKSEKYIFIIPTIIESFILLICGLLSDEIVKTYPDVIACSLLFAMGLQNSLVTKISNAVVRTTHLTGLFTDLGIELSQLFFYKTAEQKQKLYSSIKLRLMIILFFFTGGVVGGVLYGFIAIEVLIIGTLCLWTGLIYDYVKFRILLMIRKYGNQKSKNL